MSTDLIKDFKLDSIYIVESLTSNGSCKRGTCFSISDSLILTANHVVSEAASLKIFLSSDNYADDKWIEATYIYGSDQLDVAILKVANGITSNIIELYKTTISQDSEVKSCGYPVEKGHYHAPINVEVTNTFAHMTSKEFSFEVSQSSTVSQYKGMSGSPVLYGGRCIGILLVQQSSNTLYAVSAVDFLNDESIKKAIESDSIAVKLQEGLDYKSPTYPKSPFSYCIHCTKDMPSIKGIDIGFTLECWTIGNFTETVYDWIIDYALSHKAKANFKGSSRSLFKYARDNYPSSDLNALADLCLHIAIRESYSTIPIMNKVFDQNNKTFSCTHAVLNFDSIELWIGASSVSTTVEDAVKQAIENVEYIANIQSLKTRLYALTSEIDSTWPHKNKLERLADSELDLEDRFDKIIIPIFIMHDSELITNYDKNKFISSFEGEIQACRRLIQGELNESLVKLINLRVFYFPVSNINQLNDALIKELNS